MKKLLSAFLVTLVCLAFAQTDGMSSGITAPNLAKLRKLHMKLLAPTHVPDGYKVTGFEIEDAKDPARLSWSVTWKNPKTKGEFTLQMCSEGIGDILFDLPNGDVVEPNSHIPFSSKPVGKGDIEAFVKGKIRLWHVNWVELKSKPTFVSLIGSNMNASEGKRIVESLRWLK